MPGGFGPSGGFVFQCKRDTEMSDAFGELILSESDDLRDQVNSLKLTDPVVRAAYQHQLQAAADDEDLPSALTQEEKMQFLRRAVVELARRYKEARETLITFVRKTTVPLEAPDIPQE